MRHLDVVAEFVRQIHKLSSGSDQLSCTCFSPGAPNHVNSRSLPHTHIWQVLGVLISYICNPLLSKRPDRWPVSCLRLWSTVNGFLLHALLSGQRSAAPARACGFPSSPIRCIPSLISPVSEKLLTVCFSSAGSFGIAFLLLFWCLRFWTLLFLLKRLFEFLKQCLSVLGINGWVTILSPFYWISSLNTCARIKMMDY